METKLDRLRLMQEERAKRAENIAYLDEQIKDARHLLAVIPANGYEEEQERRTVQEHIKFLSGFKADEERAYNATFEAAPNDIENVNL